MGIQIKVKNFRCLRDVDWSPDGVCVLVGPNGSGKTTLFDALNFLSLISLIYNFGLKKAIEAAGGRYFRRLDAPPEDAVEIAVIQGAATWTLGISNAGGPVDVSINESLRNARSQ